MSFLGAKSLVFFFNIFIVVEFIISNHVCCWTDPFFTFFLIDSVIIY